MTKIQLDLVRFIKIESNPRFSYVELISTAGVVRIETGEGSETFTRHNPRDPSGNLGLPHKQKNI